MDAPPTHNSCPSHRRGRLSEHATRARAGLGLSILLGLFILISGCANKVQPDQKQPPSDPTIVTDAPAPPPPRDAPKDIGVIIQFEVWELLVPYGTVSRNEEFWKRINENIVDLETADRLWRNGVRMGEAPISEWGYFKQIIDQNPAQARQQTNLAREAKTIELPARGERLWQDIFFYDDTNRMTGRTYEKCYNFFNLSFEPAPRRPGTVRMALCPVVRSSRRQMQFVGERESKTIEYVQAEKLYDMNLRADIPLDSFIVVAPSTEARLPTSIGANFLVVDAAAERLERVFLFVPRPFALPK